tara:strand:+ start:238 stop:705 length:468 start_codon:yes stop_codon:yes gene_type:complete
MFNEYILNIQVYIMKFILLAGFSALFFVILELLYKFSNCESINPDLFVTVWFIISGIITVPYFLYRNYHIEHIPNKIIFYIGIMALLSFVGNLIYWNACKNIKNPGITRTVYSGVLIMLLAIISAVTFKKYLSYIQSFSILLIIAGISLLLMNND